jgi:Leucine-rich repeat (LRR) protein
MMSDENSAGQPASFFKKHRAMQKLKELLHSENEENFNLGIALAKTNEEWFIEEYGVTLAQAVETIEGLLLIHNLLIKAPFVSGFINPLNIRGLAIHGYIGLESLPEYISVCKELETIYIAGNPIGRLPASIAKLNKLTSLTLKGQFGLYFTKVPEIIKDIHSLQELDMSGNMINEVPDWLFEMPNLHTFDVGSKSYDKRDKRWMKLR